jgi:hypothetical protein
MKEIQPSQSCDSPEERPLQAAAYCCQDCGSVELGELMDAEFECGWCGGRVVAVQVRELMRLRDCAKLVGKALRLGAAYGEGAVQEACAEVLVQLAGLLEDCDDVEI